MFFNSIFTILSVIKMKPDELIWYIGNKDAENKLKYLPMKDNHFSEILKV